MALSIKQGFKYEGDDYWSWWVWLDGSPGELNNVSSVTYTLHRTFPNPVRTITDRASKFKLETAGWGVFQIKATARLSNGSLERLTHYLELEYPDGTPTTA
jgi:transcription initiation factor IIF auxiliary subunit